MAVIVTTGATTGITGNSATLNGSVTGFTGEWSYYQQRGFKWGKSPGVYTDEWYEAGHWTSAMSWSHEVTGLDAGTKYYFVAGVRETVDM